MSVTASALIVMWSDTGHPVDLSRCPRHCWVCVQGDAYATETRNIILSLNNVKKQAPNGKQILDKVSREGWAKDR